MLARRIRLAAVISIALGGATIGHAQQANPPAAPKPAVREALAKANLLENAEEFNTLLRSIAGELPLVPTLGEKGSVSWSAARLNAAGAGVDAIRFKSSLAEPADMAWIFTLPKNATSWSIIAVDGAPMYGFQTHALEYGVDIPDLPLAEDNQLALQKLPFGQIMPEREYILWLRFKTDEPVDLHFAIRLMGVSERRTYRPFAGLSQSVAQLVGLSWPFRYQTSRFRFIEANESEGGNPATTGEKQAQP